MLNDCMRHLEDQINSSVALRLNSIEEKMPVYFEGLAKRIVKVEENFEEMKGPVIDQFK